MPTPNPENSPGRWTALFKRAVGHANRQDWEPALADATEALRLARADPFTPADMLNSLEHFHLHVLSDAEKARGSEDGELRKTIRVFTDTSFQDMHLDWQVAEMTRHGEFLAVRFLPNTGSTVRLIVFKLYGLTAATCYAWFDKNGDTMDLIHQDPRANLDEMVALLLGPAERMPSCK